MSQFGDLVTTDPVLNAETRVPTVIAICVTFSLISFAALLLRLYTRIFILRRPGVDDATIVVAEVLALLTGLGAGMESSYGLGRHTWTVSAEDKLMQQKWLYLVVIVYNLTTNVIKLSFLLQYQRLFVGEWTLRVCKWALVVIPVGAVIQITLLGTACLPLASIVPSMVGHCLDSTLVWYITSAVNIITDFAIFLIPLPSIIGLRMLRKKQKMLLLLIFSIGFFVCIISIIRIFTLSQRTQSADDSWTGVSPACWSIVEIHTGILCSCLATLRPFIRRVFPCLADSEDSGAAPYELNNVQTTSLGKRNRSEKTQHAARPPSSSSARALKDRAAEFTAEFPRRKDSAGRLTAIYCGRDGRENSSSDGLEAVEAQSPPATGERLHIYVQQSFETRYSRVLAAGRQMERQSDNREKVMA